MTKTISEHPFIKVGKTTHDSVGHYALRIKLRRFKLLFHGIAIFFKVLFKTDKS